MSLNPLDKSGNPEKRPSNYRVVYPSVKHQAYVKGFVGSLTEKNQELIMTAIVDLGKDPRPHGFILIKPPVPALSILAHYRIKQGDFRIFYDIKDDQKIVYILAVKQRNEKTYRR